ncbi:MAG: hypothetical protein M1820_006914 [Bogoriella megaspora]|nr:MAG: hypothetical protein M1820_006914 [Bogoriella megaspora]
MGILSNRAVNKYLNLIVVPSQVLQSIDPAWASCSADIRGLYDPPHALQGFAEAAAPTPVTLNLHTSTISPKPSLTPTQPQRTPSPGDPKPTIKPSSGSNGGDPGVGGGSQSGSSGSDPSSGGDGSSSPGDPASGSRDLSGDDPPYGDSSDNAGLDSGSTSSKGGYGGDPPSHGASGSGAVDGSGPSVGRPKGSSDPHGTGSAASTAPDPQSEHASGNNPAGDPAGAVVVILGNVGGSKESGDRSGSDAGSDTGRKMASIVNNAGHGPQLGADAGIDAGHVVPAALGGSSVIDPNRNDPNNEKASQPIATVGSQVIATDPTEPDAVIISGHILRPGESTTIDGTPVSVRPGQLFVDGSAIPIPAPTAGPTPAAVFRIGGQMYTAQPGKPVIIDGTTLFPAGPAATIDGQVVSVGKSAIMFGSETITFARASPTDVQGARQNTFEEDPIFSISGRVYTAYEDPNNSSIAIIVGSNGVATTISLGGPPATIDGQIVSLRSDGVFVGTSEARFHVVSKTGQPDQEAVFTDDSRTVHTAREKIGASTIVIDGSITLTLGGPAVTIDGEAVSLGSDGLVVGKSTVGFEAATTTSRPTAEAQGEQSTSSPGQGVGGVGGAEATAPTGAEGIASGGGCLRGLSISTWLCIYSSSAFLVFVLYLV